MSNRTASGFRRLRDAALGVALSASLALTPAATAWAAAPGSPGAVEVEVLSFSSNDAVDEAAALTDAFKHALIGAPGVTDHGKSHALEAVALTAGCDDPMAPACGPKIAAEIKYDKFIYGTVKKSPPNKITATLNYYNAGQVKTVAKTYDAGPVEDGASPELKKIALDTLLALLGGAPKGKVEVTVAGPAASEDGELFEGGQSIGKVTAGKGEVDLPSGTHTIELRMKGFSSATGEVEVTPAGATLQLSPVRLAPPKPLDWQLYGGIAAVAAGAIFVGLGVSNSLAVKNAQDEPAFDAYRRRWPASTKDTCAEAKAGREGPAGTTYTDKLAGQVKDICDDVSSKQTMQFVWYGVGAAFVVGGIVLIATDKGTGADKSADKTAGITNLKLHPVLSPTFQAFSLTGSF